MVSVEDTNPTTRPLPSASDEKVTLPDENTLHKVVNPQENPTMPPTAHSPFTLP